MSLVFHGFFRFSLWSLHIDILRPESSSELQAMLSNTASTFAVFLFAGEYYTGIV
jgi:hypothetical protein